MSMLLIILLILSSSLSSYPQNAQRPSSNSNYDEQLLLSRQLLALKFPHSSSPIEQYSNFKLVLIWGPSYCKVVSCVIVRDYFTLHGLWPDNGKFKGDNTRVDRKVIFDLQYALRYIWPDLELGGFRYYFYYGKWRHHGLYCSTRFDAKEYFELAVNLGTQYSNELYAVLMNGGITPNKTGYDPHKIAQAITSGLGHGPELVCKTSRVDEKSYLIEVRLCFNESGEKLISCGGQKITCYHSTQVYFLPAPGGEE